MPYPKVLTEDETLNFALAGWSLARYGDGELRLATGRDCISQRETSPELIAELRAVLVNTHLCCLLPCIPNAFSATPRAESWANYTVQKYTALYEPTATYGSSFITRPDSAPWIDRPDYWERMRALWRGKSVTLVTGEAKRSITPQVIEADGGTVRLIVPPRTNAYARIDAIEEEIGTPSGPVIICLGPTATVLAARLARKGLHALDLGHAGMFMRHAGAYRYQGNDLVTDAYREQLSTLHASGKWGADGAKHVDAVRAFIAEIAPETILDYGCGRMRLAEELTKDDPPRRVSGYDPGIPGREKPPKPGDLVVCTDVLEHVEPDRLDAVLDHIHRLTGKGAYLVIATRPAKAVLPDGRNAHLIVRDGQWWLDKLSDTPWRSIVARAVKDRELRVWLRK